MVLKFSLGKGFFTVTKTEKIQFEAWEARFCKMGFCCLCFVIFLYPSRDIKHPCLFHFYDQLFRGWGCFAWLG